MEPDVNFSCRVLAAVTSAFGIGAERIAIATGGGAQLRVLDGRLQRVHEFTRYARDSRHTEITLRVASHSASVFAISFADNKATVIFSRHDMPLDEVTVACVLCELLSTLVTEGV